MGVIARVLGKELSYDNWPKSHDSYRSDMARAAGIGVARIRCHRTTWDYLLESVPRNFEEELYSRKSAGAAFRPPSKEEITAEKDGMATVPLSGTALAAVLSWCRNIQSHTVSSPWSTLDRSIGRRVGVAISQALDNVVPCRGQDGPTAMIYLDDRIAESDVTT
ncbi:hypothetical protein [Streptomyces minutiscleroticus]|uniref:Uncharacterized protein n=1 Tax=Streptomyces minutiscleroticus TaxID=68238 RepID=A0A918NZR5_9ACTN|nr:hypothetical protein [Streptomyces minutiscleroticus]GGY07797.1 hypothetical protein GCM10010358_71110 [Streptomyces minutiscleroticus]